jgi:hypothetical protein
MINKNIKRYSLYTLLITFGVGLGVLIKTLPTEWSYDKFMNEVKNNPKDICRVIINADRKSLSIVSCSNKVQVKSVPNDSKLVRSIVENGIQLEVEQRGLEAL